MSLKHFHAFFIFAAALFAGAMSVWGFIGRSHEVLGDAARPFAFLSATISLCLLLYGLWFALKKSKTITL